MKSFLLTFFTLLIFHSNSAYAGFQQFCFGYASTLYEQLYCELSSKGKARDLPSFYDFKNNNEQMQFFMLKPKARYLSIKLPKPSSEEPLQEKKTEHTSLKQNLTVSNNHFEKNCHWQKSLITCGNKQYSLLFNLNNKFLSAAALTDKNLMALPKPTNNKLYLEKAYRHYLIKMIEIGLAGVTLSYEKFNYLFHELKRRNINFSARFETMFFYLKKDKNTMTVNTQKIHPKKIIAQHCYYFSEYWACSSTRNNYVFKEI